MSVVVIPANHGPAPASVPMATKADVDAALAQAKTYTDTELAKKP